MQPTVSRDACVYEHRSDTNRRMTIRIIVVDCIIYTLFMLDANLLE